MNIEKVMAQGARQALYTETHSLVVVASNQLNTYEHTAPNAVPYDDIITKLQFAIQGLEHLKTLATTVGT